VGTVSQKWKGALFQPGYQLQSVLKSCAILVFVVKLNNIVARLVHHVFCYLVKLLVVSSKTLEERSMLFITPRIAELSYLQ